MARTDIDWILLDGRGAPTRIPTEFDAVFGAPVVQFGLARVPLGESPGDARHVSFTVRPQELDPMNHVNNAAYADWLDEAVIAAGDAPTTRALPRLARLEYAAPADAGSRVFADVWPARHGWSFSVRDEAGHALLRARLEPGPS